MPREQLYVVTLTVADNPLRGMPGQTDYTLTISSVPDLKPPEGQPLPDPETLSPALLASVACVAQLAELSYEAAFIHIASQDN